MANYGFGGIVNKRRATGRLIKIKPKKKPKPVTSAKEPAQKKPFEKPKTMAVKLDGFGEVSVELLWKGKIGFVDPESHPGLKKLYEKMLGLFSSREGSKERAEFYRLCLETNLAVFIFASKPHFGVLSNAQRGNFSRQLDRANGRPARLRGTGAFSGKSPNLGKVSLVKSGRSRR